MVVMVVVDMVEEFPKLRAFVEVVARANTRPVLSVTTLRLCTGFAAHLQDARSTPEGAAPAPSRYRPRLGSGSVPT